MSTVYILRMVGTDCCKIGYTANGDVLQRVKALQPACPKKLEIVMQFDGGDKHLESVLHCRYKKRQLNGGKEWFDLDAFILQELREEFLPDGVFRPLQNLSYIVDRIGVSKLTGSDFKLTQDGILEVYSEIYGSTYLVRKPRDGNDAEELLRALIAISEIKDWQ
jgi:hypothetical protein